MRLALIFDKERSDTTGIYFERACRTLGISHDHWWLKDSRKIPSAYDLYLRIDDGSYDFDIPKGLAPAAFYAIDTHLPRSWKRIKRCAVRYDLVFCAQSDAARKLPGAEWLPLGCDPDLNEPSDARGAWDVAFVGTDGGLPRKFVLQAVRERYPNSYIGGARYSKMMSIYRQAKIGLNYSIRGEVNMRFFEVLGAGAALVTNALPEDELSRLGLREGEHFLAYRMPCEVFARIDELLRDNEKRAQIAVAGMREARQKHTYVNRMRRLLAVASQRLKINYPFTVAKGATCKSL